MRPWLPVVLALALFRCEEEDPHSRLPATEIAPAGKHHHKAAADTPAEGRRERYEQLKNQADNVNAKILELLRDTLPSKENAQPPQTGTDE
jgi:hypothetical protein